MLVNITSIGCTKLGIDVIVVNIDSFINSFEINKYIPTTNVSCKEINETTLEIMENEILHFTSKRLSTKMPAQETS